jgi:hypothetical protein
VWHGSGFQSLLLGKYQRPLKNCVFQRWLDVEMVALLKNSFGHFSATSINSYLDKPT